MNIIQEDFERLLSWLDTDRERAGVKYEIIRHRLIEIFACRGCPEAEDLADETINRVMMKVQEIADTYTGDPAHYFYGVAQKVYLEYLRKKPRSVQPPPTDSPEDIEQVYQCLDQCLQQLTPNNCDLVLRYYFNDKSKIINRKELADRLGIALNALRIRAHRIRATLRECVKKCLQQSASG